MKLGTNIHWVILIFFGCGTHLAVTPGVQYWGQQVQKYIKLLLNGCTHYAIFNKRMKFGTNIHWFVLIIFGYGTQLGVTPGVQNWGQQVKKSIKLLLNGCKHYAIFNKRMKFGTNIHWVILIIFGYGTQLTVTPGVQYWGQQVKIKYIKLL